jgi:chromosome segregation ATPase
LSHSQGVTAEQLLPPLGHELRYRRLGGGYRRDDVERVLAELQYAMRLLENDLEALRSRSAGLEGEVHEVRAELEAYRDREGELEQVAEVAGSVLERAKKLEAAASGRSRGVAAAVDSLRAGLNRLERAVAELGVSDAEGPADRPESAAP